MIVKETKDEFKIYAFLSNDGLERNYPDDEERKRFLASCEYVSINKHTARITLNYSNLRLDSFQTADLIKALNRARAISDKISEGKTDA